MLSSHLRSVLTISAVALAGCKTTKEDTSLKVWGFSSCKKQAPVEYQDAKSTSNPLGGTGVDIDLFDIVSIQVKPEDFSSLDANECKANGTCTALLTKPVTVNANIPVTLFAKVALTYEQKKGPEENVCLREVKVGTSIATPSCIGKILKVSINMGLGVTQAQNDKDDRTTYDFQPYCNAKFNCSTPLVTAHAKADENGLTFGSALSGPQFARKMMVKVQAPPQKADATSLPGPLQKLKDYYHNRTTDLGTDKPSEPDLFWEDLANPCGL